MNPRGATKTRLELVRGTLDVLILKALMWGPLGTSENNRKAKFYELTTAGRKQLREEVKAWTAYSAAVAKMLDATQPRASGEV